MLSVSGSNTRRLLQSKPRSDSFRVCSPLFGCLSSKGWNSGVQSPPEAIDVLQQLIEASFSVAAG